MSEERTEQVSTYVTPDVKDQLKNEARQEGIPLSKYVRQLLERARLEDTQEQLARDLNAEERLLELIAEGKDEMAAIAEDVRRQNEQIADRLGDLDGGGGGDADRQHEETDIADENDSDPDPEKEAARAFVDDLR